ncbi:MAG: hypothetical protein MJ106_01390 [Lentisphaeria bacterium]|nr:hypothetical protein [Lentisphaeria bacterium]
MMCAPERPQTTRHVLCLACALLMFSVRTFALTLYVDSVNGSDYNDGATEYTALQTIGTALTITQWLGQDENTILVAPGTYTEGSNRNLLVYGQNLEIIATGPAGSSIIDLQQNGNFLTIDNGANATIQNLTIQNGLSTYQRASAIDIYDGTLTAIDCSLKDNSGPGEVIYAEEGRLVMQNCILDGHTEPSEEYGSASISADSANVSLLNCTLTGGGMLLSSYGDTILNNTIIDGGCELNYSASANNCYAWDNLSSYGSDNIQGVTPGLNAAGVPNEDSVCVSSGNDDYYVDSDLRGSTRMPGAVSIGALEPNSDATAAEAQEECELGFYPKPSINSQHSCSFRIETNVKDRDGLNCLPIDCGTFHSFGKNFSALASYVLNNIHLAGKCEWATYNPVAYSLNGFGGERTYTTATTNGAAFSTLSISPPLRGMGTHPSFASQYAPGTYVLPVTFNCVEKNSQAVDIRGYDHTLKWTDTASENKKCSMEGRIPQDDSAHGRRYAQKRSLVLPYAASVPLNVEWTGGDIYKTQLMEWAATTAPETGALLLTHKKCVDCGAEERLSPMPADYSRLLPHVCLYQTPENYYDDVLEKINGTILHDDECGGIDFNSLGLKKFAAKQDCTCNFLNIGYDTATFRKICVPYVAESAHRHQNLSGDLFHDVKVPACGSAEFSYEAEVIGIQDVTVTQQGCPESQSLLMFDVDSTTQFDKEHYAFIAREVTKAEAEACFRQERPAPTIVLSATSTSDGGMKWPTPDDHPLYGDIDDRALGWFESMEKLEWRFPRWIGLEEGDALDGNPIVTKTYKGRHGIDSITASCYDNTCFMQPVDDEFFNWDYAAKNWKIVIGDINITLDGKGSPLPLLVLNDNNDSGIAWPDAEAKADKEQTGPIDYVDSELKALTVSLDDIFSALPAKVLERLAIRVDVEGDYIRCFGDQKKNPVGFHDSRWSGSQNCFYFSLIDDFDRKGIVKTSCTLYVEGIDEGTANIKATLVDKNSMDDNTSISETLKVAVVRVGLIPDYNCDGKIDDVDADFASKGRVMRMWTNCNRDVEKKNLWDFEAGRSENCSDDVVNGRGDLLDFFPVWLDAKSFLALEPPKGRLTVRLRHSWNKLNAVYTELSPSNVVQYMISDDELKKAIPTTKRGKIEIHCTNVNALCSEGVPEKFLEACASGNGIVLCEGNLKPVLKCPSELVLELCMELDGKTTCLARRSLTTSISDVYDMIRTFNLRGCEKKSYTSEALEAYLEESQMSDPPNMPSTETDDIKVYFVHGYNMDEAESYDWMGRLYKRLYRSGVSCQFVGVDWYGNDGDWGAYQKNVENAFCTAPFLDGLVDATSCGNEKRVFIAHSLGNMIVSSAMEDYGMKADLFILLNAAVASEAYEAAQYDGEEDSAKNKMLPVKWHGFVHVSRAAEWYTHHPNDNRGRLAWPGRFKNIRQSCTEFLNFFDPKDEVIRVIHSPILHLLTGAALKEAYRLCELSRRRLAWQKQEFFKGTESFNALACTSEAGWGIIETRRHFFSIFRHWDVDEEYSHPVEVDAEYVNSGNLDFSDFNQAIFIHVPEEMNNPELTEETRNHLLAFAIPALSHPAGTISMLYFDNNVNLAEIPMQGWPRDHEFLLNQKNKSIDMPNSDILWCHSDFMLVPYFYTHSIYETMKNHINK